MRRAIAAVVLVVAGCSGKAGGIGETTTASVDEAGPTAAAPEDAFVADVAANTEGGDPAAMVDIGTAACVALDSASTEVLLDDDAANDTPESDAAVAAQNQDMLLGVLLTEISNDEVGAVILGATGRHLCPEHAEAINNFLAGRGLTP